MTCIAAISNGKTVWIGGDSAGISLHSLEIRADEKVFSCVSKDNNIWLFGMTGSFRAAQLIRYHLPLPAVKKYFDEDPLGFMVSQFIPNLRKCFTDGGHQTTINGHATNSSIFIVGLKGKIFVVQTDYQIAISIFPYTAIGSGKDLALGALFVSENGRPEDRIYKALQAAETFSAVVRGPFKIIHS